MYRDEFITMPNHFHAILEITETLIKWQSQGIAPTETVRATFMVDPITYHFSTAPTAWFPNKITQIH